MKLTQTLIHLNSKSAIQNKSLLNKTSSKGKHWEAIFEEIQEDMNAALPEGLNTPQSLESELNIEEKRSYFKSIIDLSSPK